MRSAPPRRGSDRTSNRGRGGAFGGCVRGAARRRGETNRTRACGGSRRTASVPQRLSTLLGFVAAVELSCSFRTDERVDQVVQVARHHAVELVQREVDPVVGRLVV